MQTKPLLYGLIGFFIGGLLVSVAATTFDKPAEQKNNDSSMMESMQMSARSLENKTGDDFDAAFISEMIVHHQGAIDMAKLAATNAKHEEVKELSRNIISAQEAEISQMRQWQIDWGYPISASNGPGMGH
ncbi:MAG TPA: DUF305 domain-containing protein [Candidatus Saccharibacteria bacterium]|nr:DUF305 domain-containing protein [Candidatus Saccharibacteria bacterium]HRK94424.1 DUF305 domain-containing protein [Candidatus Saccharibacteria bacterium]